MTKRLLLIGSLAAVVALMSAPAAGAAVRFASPGGVTAQPCNPNPCTLKYAIENAASNDEVIVGSGNYTVGTSIVAGSSGLKIHGDTNGPVPVVTSTVASFGAINALSAANLQMSYLDVTNNGAGSVAILCGAGALLDRVRATVTTNSSRAVQAEGGCSVRDSLIVAKGNSSSGLGILSSTSTSPTATNVTAIANGTLSRAVQADCSCFLMTDVTTVNLKNVIAQGATDIVAQGGFFGSAHVIATNSNFDTTIAAGSNSVTGTGNQTAPPLFVDAAASDYREAAGSPTIDAGAPGDLGPLDLAGNPRVLGSAPDIGAYEFVPPVVPPGPTPAAGEVQSLSLATKRFKAAKSGGSTISKAKSKAKVGTTASYALSAAAKTTFTVERASKGRKVGKTCKKQTSKNRKRKRCMLYKAVKGDFALDGVTGQNKFKFSGRIGNKPLKRGNYRLVGKSSKSVKTAAFSIVVR